MRMHRLRAVVSRPYLLTAVLSAWICLTLPVFAQEAYYWGYSQHPDLSYFDHPPMVAWLIWLGTKVLGDGELGLRLGTWTCGLLACAFGILLLREFGLPRCARRIWILLTLAVPAMAAARFLANPDPPLVAAWLATIYALWRARTGSLTAWLAAGMAAGLALLSKYTAAFLAIGGVIVLLFDPMMRRQLLRPGPWLALLVAIAVFTPVVVWNAQHGFESFRFQTEGRLKEAHLSLRWFAECLGIQFGMVHPVIAIALPIVVVWGLRAAHGGDRRLLWLLAFGLPMPFYLLVNSLWIQVKPNWFTPAYAALLLAFVLWWHERGRQSTGPRLRRAGTFALLAVIALAPFAASVRLLPEGGGTTWHGWAQLAAAAEKWEDETDLAASPEKHVFFFAANYRDAAQLARNLALHWREFPHRPPLVPGQPVLAQNVLGDRALQFDHWTNPEQEIGHDAIFVLPRPDERQRVVERVRRHFCSVEKVETVDVKQLGLGVLKADILVCRGYLGPRLAVEPRAR